MKNMSPTMWIPYSLTFVCKKPLSVKFTEKRNFLKLQFNNFQKIIAQSDYRVLVSAETEIIQTEGYSTGGPLSVTLADIHLIRTENDAVKPFKPVFYKQYDDDIYNRRNLLQKLLQKTEE